MTAAQHTPGPWRVERTPGADSRLIKDGSGTVAEVFADDGGSDARLIAAAPELLAIVQMVANLGEYRELVEKMAKALRPHERDAFVKLYREDARAAIAKANDGEDA